jgi:hypothetical protein
LRLSDLKGALKVFVKAEGFSETEKMLHQFKEALPSKSDAYFSVTYPFFSQLR